MITKAKQRLAARAARAGQDPALGARLAMHVLEGWPIRPGAVVSGFLPLPQEIDIRPLLLALAGRGHPIALPVAPPRGQPLAFALWRPGEALVAGRFGTLEPTGAPAVPDVLLVPLLAFDRQCHRLGYGGGYYDRTLQGLPGRAALGCAFASQEVGCVVAEAHDIPLDAIATEHGLIIRAGR